MSHNVLDVVAVRFIEELGLQKSRAEVRADLEACARSLRNIMDRYSLFGCPNDMERTPVFVLDSVGRATDHFVAKISIEGTVLAAVVRYWPD